MGRDYADEAYIRGEVARLSGSKAPQVVLSIPATKKEAKSIGGGHKHLRTALLSLAVELMNEQGYFVVSPQQPLALNPWTVVFEKRKS